MMKIHDFAIHHLAQLGRGVSGLFLDEFPDMNDRLKVYVGGGPAFTLFDGDQPVACGGVVLAWKGVGEAWLIPHENPRPWGREIIYAARHFLRMICKREKLHRLQACCVCNHGIDYRWFRAMGFKDEPVLLKKYTPTGKDCLLYARLF